MRNETNRFTSTQSAIRAGNAFNREGLGRVVSVVGRFEGLNAKNGFAISINSFPFKLQSSTKTVKLG